MVTKSQLLKMLPPFKGDYHMVVFDQTTKDIVKAVCEMHEEYAGDYDLISEKFALQNGIAQNIWDFLKYNFTYRAESEEEQTCQSPAGILQPGFKVDCKHYSLFAGGIIDSLIRNYDLEDGLDWCYRFAGYDSKHIEHVFVVIKMQDGTEIWIDPVLSYFNFHEPPYYFKDAKPKKMPLYKVSGVPLTVSKEKQIASFLTMVNLNLYNLKDLLKSDMNTVNTAVRNYFGEDDRSFKILLNILNG